MKRIPVHFVQPVLALPPGLAAKALGISSTKYWELRNLPEHDPRRIKTTSYGTAWVSELERHLQQEMKRA